MNDEQRIVLVVVGEQALIRISNCTALMARGTCHHILTITSHASLVVLNLQDHRDCDSLGFVAIPESALDLSC